jgi:hypothetical protein
MSFLLILIIVLLISFQKLIASLGVVLFHALDYGLCEDEERSLSKPLELLIEKLTSAHNQRPIHNQNNNNNEIEDEFAKDEGIERDCGHEDNNSFEDLMTFDKVIQVSHSFIQILLSIILLNKIYIFFYRCLFLLLFCCTCPFVLLAMKSNSFVSFNPISNIL